MKQPNQSKKEPTAPTVPRITSTIPDWRDAVAGASAGAVSRTLMAPVERVKLLLQLQGSIIVSTNTQTPTTNASTTTTTTTTTTSSTTTASSTNTTNTTTTTPSSRKTARQVIHQVYHEQGITAFWRGNVPNVMRYAGQAGLNFMLMDYYKRLAVSLWLHAPPPPTLPLLPRRMNTTTTTEAGQQRLRKRALVTSFVSGGLAGGTATTVLYPVEFLRTRLAMDLGGSSSSSKTPRLYPNGMRDVLIQTVKADGYIRGLYQGYGIALLGGVLYRLLFLGGYDAFKTEMELYKKNKNKKTATTTTTTTIAPIFTWGERFAMAQVISLTAGTVCYPIDSVRRRMMMQAGTPLEVRRYRGSLHCFQVVWVQEGLRGFYLGIGPNIIRSVGGALMLVAYDIFKGMR